MADDCSTKTDGFSTKAICFLAIFFIVGEIFSYFFNAVLTRPYGDITGFSIGLIAAAAFCGVALQKFW